LLRSLLRVAQWTVLAVSLASVASVLTTPQGPLQRARPDAARSVSTPEQELPAEAPPTAHERQVQRELEAQLRSEARKDRVVTVQGKVIQGKILGESASGVRILRSFGDSGDMEMTLARRDIKSIERGRTELPPPIRLRDVRFKLEFADFNLYRRPPFTIVTDQSFFEVQDATRTLDELHGDFVHAFTPLIRDRERSDGIQLLFFSDEKQFNAYRDEFAPALGYASGFYSPMKDRLVIYDQANSQWVDQASQQIDGQREAYRDYAAQRGAGIALHEWHQSAKRTLGSIAERANRMILRHEGAHQLFHTYGVHSEEGVEHLWLIEGLAAYCEEKGDPGAKMRAEELKAVDDPHALAFPELINFASREGIGSLGGAAEIDLFYPKAWLVVDHLMKRHREPFFEYVRYVRDPANQAALEDTTDFALLSGFVGLSQDQLHDELQRALLELL
jgi:hypothetical protein